MGIGAEGEGTLEHGEQDSNEDGETDFAVGEHSVDTLLAGMVAVVVAMLEGGSEGAIDISVTGLVDNLLGGSLKFHKEVLALALHKGRKVFIIGFFAKKRKGLDRTFEESDGEVTLRVESGKWRVGRPWGEEFDDALDGMHHILAVVDMHVTQHLQPTLGGTHHLGGKIIYTLSRKRINNSCQHTHLLLKTVYVE